MTKIGEHKHCVKCNAVLPSDHRLRERTLLEWEIVYALGQKDNRVGMCDACGDHHLWAVYREALRAIPEKVRAAENDGYRKGWVAGYDRKPRREFIINYCPVCASVASQPPHLSAS